MRKRVFGCILAALLLWAGVLHAQGIIAHRGFWKADGAVQNGLVALQAACDASGCRGVECDARLTADSVLVIVHDRDLDGKHIDAMHYHEVARYRNINGETIPTAEAYMQKASLLCDNTFKLFFEIKPAQSQSQRGTYVNQCVELVRRHQMADRTEFISFDLEMCKMLAARCPDIPVAYLGGNRTPEELHALGIDGIDYHYSILLRHPEWIQQAHTLGMSVNAWTVDDKADAQKLSKLGVDWITTNEPVRMGAWLRNEPIYRFISFNIRQSGFPEYDGEHAWPNRKETVVKMIRDEAPDAFGVQEMLPEQRDYLLKHLPEYAMVGVGRDDGHDEGENMAIFYLKKRFRILKEHTFWLSETPDSVSFGWDAACRRTVTEALLQDKRTKCVIDYFNTHLDHVGKVARRESVLLLVRQMEEAAKEGVPVLLSGDMNSSLADTIFTPLFQAGFLPLRWRTPQTDEEDSFNGYGIVSNAFANNTGANVIDHFFAKNLFAIQFKTLVGYYGVPYISDHYPIVVEFSVPAGKKGELPHKESSTKKN